MSKHLVLYRRVAHLISRKRGPHFEIQTLPDSPNAAIIRSTKGGIEILAEYDSKNERYFFTNPGFPVVRFKESTCPISMKNRLRQLADKIRNSPRPKKIVNVQKPVERFPANFQRIEFDEPAYSGFIVRNSHGNYQMEMKINPLILEKFYKILD